MAGPSTIVMMRMKSNRISKESSIGDFNESILFNILIFLPLKCIMRCRCVCKDWATLIAQPYFIEYYDSTKKSGLTQILIEDRCDSNNLILAQIDEAACNAISPADFLIPRETRLCLKFLDYIPDPRSYLLKVFTSCSVTGYIAAFTYDGRNESSPPISCHIFNSVTGKHILVDDNTNSYRWARCALLYVEKTNQFKFLYFHPWRSDYETDGVEIDIQTIGTNSNSWRSMGKIPFNPSQISNPTLANGLYHWIHGRKRIIYSFDAEQEVFKRVQTPRIKFCLTCNLGLVNGCLCICVKTCNIEFWVMSEYGDVKSWTKRLVLPDFGFYPEAIIEPLKCLENGDIEIMTLRFHNHVMSYNPSTRRFRSIRFGESASFRYTPFSFIPSLRTLLRATPI